jgi:hypothetical protein
MNLWRHGQTKSCADNSHDAPRGGIHQEPIPVIALEAMVVATVESVVMLRALGHTPAL